MNVSISRGNSKMGSIPSVSLPSGLTCGDVPCIHKCYARKLERIRPNVRESYENNFRILINDAPTYWREVEAAIMMARFFRWHVSGDIYSAVYLRKMVEIAERNPHCEMLCFTKRYDLVNKEIDAGLVIPENLHLIFSIWKNYPCNNPHGLPEAHVRYRDGTTTASDSAVPCEGNCTQCAVTEGGCWSLKNGGQVVFNEH